MNAKKEHFRIICEFNDSQEDKKRLPPSYKAVEYAREKIAEVEQQVEAKEKESAEAHRALSDSAKELTRVIGERNAAWKQVKALQEKLKLARRECDHCGALMPPEQLEGE